MNYGMCGRWRNGRLASMCALAGTEECDFECPHRDEGWGDDDPRVVAAPAEPDGVTVAPHQTFSHQTPMPSDKDEPR